MRTLLLLLLTSLTVQSQVTNLVVLNSMTVGEVAPAPTAKTVYDLPYVNWFPEIGAISDSGNLHAFYYHGTDSSHKIFFYMDDGWTNSLTVTGMGGGRPGAADLALTSDKLFLLTWDNPADFYTVREYAMSFTNGRPADLTSTFTDDFGGPGVRGELRGIWLASGGAAVMAQSYTTSNYMSYIAYRQPAGTWVDQGLTEVAVELSGTMQPFISTVLVQHPADNKIWYLQNRDSVANVARSIFTESGGALVLEQEYERWLWTDDLTPDQGLKSPAHEITSVRALPYGNQVFLSYGNYLQWGPSLDHPPVVTIGEGDAGTNTLAAFINYPSLKHANKAVSVENDTIRVYFLAGDPSGQPNYSEYRTVLVSGLTTNAVQSTPEAVYETNTSVGHYLISSGNRHLALTSKKFPTPGAWLVRWP